MGTRDYMGNMSAEAAERLGDARTMPIITEDEIAAEIADYIESKAPSIPFLICTDGYIGEQFAAKFRELLMKALDNEPGALVLLGGQVKDMAMYEMRSLAEDRICNRMDDE
jgi:hypothetical protein